MYLHLSLLSLCLSLVSSQWVPPTPAMFHDNQPIYHTIPPRSSVTFPVTLIDYIGMSTLIWTNASSIEASINQPNNHVITYPGLIAAAAYQPTIILPRTAQNDPIQPSLISICDAIRQSINATSRTCTVNVTLYNRDAVEQVVQHSLTQYIMNLAPDDSVTTIVNRGEWAYFGVPLTSDDTSLLISLSFPDSSPGQNVDLYISNEEAREPDDFLFPNKDLHGSMYDHPAGQPMKLLLGPSPNKGFSEGIYLFALYSPLDTPAARTRFTLEFQSRIGRTSSFTAALFGIIASLVVLVLCMFLGCVMWARNRRRHALTVSINQSLAQLQNGETAAIFLGSNGRMMMVSVHPVNQPVHQGVPPEQIAALPTHTYQNIPGDEGRCTICLDDYVDGVSRLKQLPCGHKFDVNCIDTWLSSHKQCPLCQQNIDTAHDVAKHDPPKPIHQPTVAAPAPEVELQQLDSDSHVVEIAQPPVEEFKESG